MKTMMTNKKNKQQLETSIKPTYTDEESAVTAVEDMEVVLESDSFASAPRRRQRRKYIYLATGILVAVTLIVAGVVSMKNDSSEVSSASSFQNQNQAAPAFDDEEEAETATTPTTSPTISTNVVEPTIGTTLEPPTSSPTAAPASYTKGCLPDRFDNEGMDLTVDPEVNFNKLYPGQFICSKPYQVRPNADKNVGEDAVVPQRYQFGMTEQGDVVWKDTALNETVVIFENPAPDNTLEDVYFSLTTHADMMYHYPYQSQIISPTNLRHPMSEEPSRCLDNHDCPYFHLHAEGVLVLNYIADNGEGWQAKNVLRVYDLEE